MKVNPSLSIVIPLYNNGSSIEKCLDSILSTFRSCLSRIELVLVNDGSNDDTLIKLNKYLKNSNIKLFNQNNLGVSQARNTGIAQCKGQYIWFIDADDEIKQFNGNDLLKLISEEKADVYLFGFEKKFIYMRSRIEANNVKRLIRGLYSKEKLQKCFSKIFNIIDFNSPCNKIYKRSILEHSHIRFLLDMKSGEDAVFNCNFLAECRSVYIIPELLYIYNIRGTSNRKYNRSYYKDLRIMLKEMKEFSWKYRLDSSFLSNKYVEAQKGIIDNLFLKYESEGLSPKQFFRLLKKQKIKYKMEFWMLSNRNKIKYILFINSFFVFLKCIAKRSRRVD